MPVGGRPLGVDALILEHLCNLDALPSHGCRLFAPVVRITPGASSPSACSPRSSAVTVDDATSVRAQILSVTSLSTRKDVRRISQHLSDVAGVTALRVDLAARTVTVHGNANESELRSAITAAGYAVTAAST